MGTNLTLITDPRAHRAVWVRRNPHTLLQNGGMLSPADLERWACDRCMAPLDPDHPIKVVDGPEGRSLCARCAPKGQYEQCPCEACTPRSLSITNHGPLITASNYWQTDMAQRGLLYLSVNAGCFRLLIPNVHVGMIPDIRQGAKSVIVSMLRPEKWQPDAYCVEFLVEDRSNSPWACHLSPGQVDRVPLPDDVTPQWVASVWDGQRGRPHKCIERPARFRFVTKLPWLKPWEEETN